MPGLFGFIKRERVSVNENEDLVSRMASVLKHQDSLVVETYIDSRAAIGRVMPDGCHTVIQPLKSLGNRYIMFTDGYFDVSGRVSFRADLTVSKSVEIDGNHWILDLFEQKRIALGDSLQGIFNIAVYDSQNEELFIFPDRYGALPLYFVFTATGFFFSCELKALLVVPDVAKDIDKKALSDFLCLGHFIGEETFFKRIRLFSYGRSYSISASLRLHDHKYWDYPDQFNYYPSEITRDILEESTHKIETAILKFLADRSSKGAVTLSDGLDSRAICAFAGKVCPDITCLHIGNTQNRGTRIAQEVCQRLGHSWLLIDRDLPFSKEHLEDISYLSDGHLNCCQFWLASILPFLQGLDFVIDGALLDVVYEMIGDFPLLDAQYRQLLTDSRAKDFGDAFDFIIKPYWPLANDLAKEVFDPYILSQMRSFKETTISHLEAFGSLDRGALSAYFYFTGRGRRFVWPMPLLSRNVTHVFFPGFDYEYFDYGTQLPVTLRLEANMNRTIMYRNFANLRDLPWGFTGLPISKYRTPFSDLKRKVLSRYNYYLSRITQSRHGVGKGTDSYRFRSDPQFRKAHLDILLDDRTGRRGYVSMNQIKRLVRFQDIGKIPFNILQRIITVEMFYRHFID